MLFFHPPTLRRDAARHGVKSLAFDIVVLVLAAALIAASLWSVAGHGSAKGLDPSASKGVEAARPYVPAYPIRAS